MKSLHHSGSAVWLLMAVLCVTSRLNGLEPIPDKLVVFTFDDSVASQYTVVRPLLKQFGYRATFFITEGFSFRTNKQDYLTWDQIAELHRDGFEIGNHTRDHLGVAPQTLGQLKEQVEAINQRCAEHQIPRPISFGYPGNALTPGALPILKELGFRFARRGGAPEHAYDWGRGFAYEPGRDHPLLIPSAGDARPDWTLADFQRAVDQARNGRIAVIQFHGVPDREHPWVNTKPERFREYLQYLQANRFRVVALRDLAAYVDPDTVPADPLAIVEERKQQRTEVVLEGNILEEPARTPIPARISIQSADGRWYFPRSAASGGSAIRYERRNGSNTNAIEMHTTLSAHPFRVELPPGRYSIRIERGKEYLPERRELVVEAGLPKQTFLLRRWINMAESGWYSGDTHNHREPGDLPNNLLAEDLNVGLPMVDWTTASGVPPTESGRGFPGAYTNAAIHVDATHVWYPRNTEYEIFQTSQTSHTLGAMVILNHQTRFSHPALPLSRVAAQARAEGALIDLEKHNWPWSIALVPIVGVNLFELANNHHWATEFAVRKWAIPAPAWMKLSGTGTDTERDWTLYGFHTYYALLNCGLRLSPAAGTANGVHPVPLGFSRVYVHLDRSFEYGSWMAGLAAGRSFVTTGPMLMAKARGHWPGAELKAPPGVEAFPLTCEVFSEQPLENLELVVNGQVAQQFRPDNTPRPLGGFQTSVTTSFRPTTTGWVAWRCFEQRPQGRFRFAHTAPWYFQVPDQPLRPRREEAEWLVQRVKEEIQRSEKVAPASLIEDYRRALQFYEQRAQVSLKP